MAEGLQFKPYARLLTMLGNQLIKNERVALVEVIKNSYDADATWVDLRFENFDENFVPLEGAQIVIEDNGHGMNEATIRDHWVNPATPGKLQRKKVRPTTPGGRVIQGEKGIGRFALLKLGRHIKITTRAEGASNELTLTLDFTKFDEDFIVKDEKNAEGRALFLEDLNIQLERSDPATVITQRDIELGGVVTKREPHGTRIVISVSDYPWNEERVKNVYLDLVRLQTIFGVRPKSAAPDEAADDGSAPAPAEAGSPASTNAPTPFEVVIHRNGQHVTFGQDRQNDLEVLMETASVLKIEDGRFDPEKLMFSFKLDGRRKTLSLRDPEVSGLKIFRRYFADRGVKLLDSRKLQSGPFGFTFFVFDLSATATGKHLLEKEQRELLKEHRIYLYRDDVRVYPYGDPTDDWLGIDIYRGTVKASELLSNEQILGFVTITQADNPQLKDKTSREGLLEVGDAFEDFRQLLRVLLAWVRNGPYEEYRRREEKKKELEAFSKKQVETAFDNAIAAVKDIAPPEVKSALTQAAQMYKAERTYLTQRAETTEHLAGVGLSVETASHDLMVAMGKSLEVIDRLLHEVSRPGAIDKRKLSDELTMLRGVLSFIEAQLKDIQLLFRSTKQRRRDIRVGELLEKVARLFQSSLNASRIELVVTSTQTPLVAKTTEAVVLQVLLNLFDNAVYWLDGSDEPRRIEVNLNGDDGTLIFADNGPGIRSGDEAYVFDPFFSGKGQEGRGLGLYIARQLLQRHDYDISLITEGGDTIQSGANFLISFVREDKK